VDKAFIAVLKASVVNNTMIALTTAGCDYGGNCSHPNVDLSPHWDQINVAATACTFYPCVKNYHAVVNDTVFTETVVRQTPMEADPTDSYTISPRPPFLPGHTLFNDHCVIDGQPVSQTNFSSVVVNKTAVNDTVIDGKNVSVPHECFYYITGDYFRPFSNFLASSLNGGCTRQAVGERFEWTSAICDDWPMKSFTNKGNATFATIDANMEAIAVAITNELRRQGSGWDGNPAYVQGTVMRETVCMQCDWKWLAFPWALLLLATLSLLIAAIETSADKNEIPIWKSSSLPLLFTGDGIGTMGAPRSIDGVEKKADVAVVRLNRGSDGWEFTCEQAGHMREAATASGHQASSTSSARARMLTHSA
jgi:hypothetical protein